jgi:hypothetical protein
MTQLTLEQANLAFDILDAMQKHFPEDPELTIEALRVVLNATVEVVEEDKL